MPCRSLAYIGIYRHILAYIGIWCHKPSNLHIDYQQTYKALAVLTKEVFKSTFTSPEIKCLLSEMVSSNQKDILYPAPRASSARSGRGAAQDDEWKTTSSAWQVCFVPVPYACLVSLFQKLIRPCEMHFECAQAIKQL